MKVACDKCNKVIDADYVKRENWLKVQTDCSTFLLCEHCAEGFWMAVDSAKPPVIEYKEATPTADVAPVVHGKWLFIANGVEDPECSVCGWAVLSRDFKNRSDLPPYHKYCGHCGAKMEGSDT